METKADLEKQREGILLRIKHLERDLKAPLDQDEDESAMDIKNREILTGLYNVEKQNLARIEEDLSRL